MPGGRRLSCIEVDGYKSLASCSIDLKPLNVFVGPNGAGKSNLLSVFDLLGAIVQERLQLSVRRAGGASTLLHQGTKRTPLLRLHAYFGQNQYEVRLVPAQGDDLTFEEEVVYFTGGDHTPHHRKVIGAGTNESALPATAQGQAGRVAEFCLDAMQSWQVFHFHDTSAQAGLKLKQPIGDNEALRRGASNLAPYLYRLRKTEPGSYQRIVDSVRSVAPFFQDFHLRPDPFNNDVIQLEWRQVDSDAYFDAHALSDGTLRFICLSTLLLQPSPPVVIVIDEPELGLHPFAIAQLAGMFQAAARSGHQLILSTQSVTLLNQFDVDDIVVTEQHGGASTFQRLDSDQLHTWLADYAIGELWEKNVLGGRPY